MSLETIILERMQNRQGMCSEPACVLPISEACDICRKRVCASHLRAVTRWSLTAGQWERINTCLPCADAIEFGNGGR